MGTEYMANKFSRHLTLTNEAKNDFKWWCALDRKIRMQSQTLTMTIESDASSTGLGARQGELKTGGRWS